MTTLAHDLSRELYALAARVQSGSLMPWQLERIRACLAPELAVLARCDERGHEPNRYRCNECGETVASYTDMPAHARKHGIGIEGRRRRFKLVDA